MSESEQAHGPEEEVKVDPELPIGKAETVFSIIAAAPVRDRTREELQNLLKDASKPESYDFPLTAQVAMAMCNEREFMNLLLNREQGDQFLSLVTMAEEKYMQLNSFEPAADLVYRLVDNSISQGHK